MNDTRRREIALGRLEHKAHKCFPRYSLHFGICPKLPVGITEKEVPQGILRVSYRDSPGWTYELNGRVVLRSVALEALQP